MSKIPPEIAKFRTRGTEIKKVGDSYYIQKITKQDIQKCFENYNRIVAVSEDVKNSFINASDINDNRLVVKYNTFDNEKIINDIFNKFCVGK